VFLLHIQSFECEPYKNNFSHIICREFVYLLFSVLVTEVYDALIELFSLPSHDRLVLFIHLLFLENN